MSPLILALALGLLAVAVLLVVAFVKTYSRTTGPRPVPRQPEQEDDPFLFGADLGDDLFLDAASAAQTLLLRARDGERVRYEVCVHDAGLDTKGAPLGWSWVIWDGDQSLRSHAFQGEDDPEGEVGVTKPYIFGDGEATCDDAVCKAVGWVSAQGNYSFLISPLEEQA